MNAATATCSTMRSRIRPTQGFTLVEMLIVLALIGLVATLAFSDLGSIFGKGRESIAKNWVKTTGPGFITTWQTFAVTSGNMDGEYPKSMDQLIADKIVNADKLKDPWGKKYQYLCPGTHNPDSYDLWTVHGGKEIGYWE